jgi:hypothetical protein
MRQSYLSRYIYVVLVRPQMSAAERILITKYENNHHIIIKLGINKQLIGNLFKNE